MSGTMKQRNNEVIRWDQEVELWLYYCLTELREKIFTLEIARNMLKQQGQNY